MTNDLRKEQTITRFGLQPLAGATQVTDAPIEQARFETMCRRFERIRAANDAVDSCLRAGGTRDYQAAFTHVLRTRADLFADMQDPSRVVAAANFNPNHDPLGRFTTSDDAVGPHGLERRLAHGTHLPMPDMHGHGRHRARGARPAQRQEGKEAPVQGTIASIRDYAKSSNNLQTCVVAAVRSMIATMRASTNDPKPVPSEEEAEKQFAVAAGTSIDWSKGLAIAAKDYAATYARIIRAVLTQNGIPSTARFNYPSSKALADDIIAAGVPVIANLITNRQGKAIYEHAVLIQWDQKINRFLVNNIDTEGDTTPHTQREVESGTIRVASDKTGTKTSAYVDIDLQNAVIFAQRP